MKRPQLFLIHFAGGNHMSYNFLIPFLKDFDVVPLELPGRGRRFNEKLLNDFNLASEDIYTLLRNKLVTDNFFIYGHSMGALIGLRVSKMLENDGISPKCLLVSGNAGPSIKVNKKIHTLSRTDFFYELAALGGTSNAVLENTEFMNFFEPILRADFKMIEERSPLMEQPILTPICAIMGGKEEQVENIFNWNKFTYTRFEYKVLEGGHFFIKDYPSDLAEIIKSFYYRSVNIFKNAK